MSFNTLLVPLLLAFCVFSQWQLSHAQADADASRTRADSVAVEAFVSRMATDSVWEVRFAEQADDLARRFTHNADSARSRLSAELDDANIRIGFLSEVLASAQGEIVSIGSRAGALSDSLSVVTGSCQGSWQGDIDDGLLTGAWALTLPSVEHVLLYEVAIPGELVTARAGDGRTVVSARSTHPNASLRLGQIFVDAPPPAIERKLSIKQGVIAALIGAFAWELAR